MTAPYAIQAQAELERRRRNGGASVAIPPAHEFISRLTIEEPQGDDTAIIPFDLWSAQEQALSVITESMRLIILKARQLGITWLILAWAYWLCIHHKGKVILFFSKGQLEADELIRRVEGIHQRYGGTTLRLTARSRSELGWSNGSRMRSLPATESAGRSFTASVVVLDEYAFMQWGAQVYTAVKPTIDGGGRLIILSTANGEEGPFYDLWQAASKGLNRFTPLFLPWTARPDRDEEWYAGVEAEALTGAEMKREYPATPEEAFTAIAAERFLDDRTLWDACLEVLPAPDDRTPLVAAVDGAVSNDHFGFVAVSRHPVRRAHVAARLVREWIPPKGGKLDYVAIDQEIRQICQQYNIVHLAYDGYQLHQMMTTMQNDGIVWTQEFSQQKDRLIADKQLYDLIVQRKFSHSGDERLTTHMLNANREIDRTEKKLRLVKRSSDKKIDLAVCASMASARCLELNL